MIGPVGSLAILTTVLSEAAHGARPECHERHKTVGVAGIFTVGRAWIVHFETPAAIFRHSKHVDDSNDRFTFEQRLSDFGTLNGPLGHQLSLISAPNRCVDDICSGEALYILVLR